MRLLLTNWIDSYLPDFVMIISVPSSLKRSHRSRLSKVALTLFRSSEASEVEAVELLTSVERFSWLLSSHNLNLFPSAVPSATSSFVQDFFLFASSVPKVNK